MCGPIRHRFLGARAAAVAGVGALLNHRNFSVPQARFVLVDDGGFDYRVAVAMHHSIGFGSVGRRSSLLSERERSAWRTHELCDKQAVPDGNDAGDPFRIGRHPPRELAYGYSAG
jgi:hypothetical protein